MTDQTEAVSAAVSLTVELVAAYVQRNSVPLDGLPALLRSTHAALVGLGQETPAAAAPREPAVPVRKSITDEFIISLEDGKRYKSLKRYLTGLGMTPADYRAKWGLPADYPMVAPAYARQRSDLAKSFGLGRGAGRGAGVPAVTAA